MAALTISDFDNVITEFVQQEVPRLTADNNLLFNDLYNNRRVPMSDKRGPRWKPQQDTHTASRFSEGGNYGPSDFVTYLAPQLGWGRYASVVQFSEESVLAFLEGDMQSGDEMANQVAEAIAGIIVLADTDLRTNDPTTGNANGMAGIPAMISASNVYAGINRATTSIWQAYVNTTGGAITEAILEDCHKAITDSRLKSYDRIALAYDFASDVVALANVVKADPPRRGEGQALTANLGSRGMSVMTPVGFFNERPIYSWPGWTSGRCDFLPMGEISLEVKADFTRTPLQKVLGKDAFQVEIRFMGQAKMRDPRKAAAATGLTT